MKKILFSAMATMVAAVSGASPAYAQSQPGIPITITKPQDVLNIMCSFAVYFFYIVVIITVIMVIYAAFLYVTARDDAEKTTRARRTLTYAAVGVLVSLCAVGFPTIIGGFTNVNSSLAPHCSILGGSNG